MSLDKTEILNRLAQLDRRDPRRQLFGAEVHQYRLYPPVPQCQIDAFEAKYSVTLPSDYRYFITEVGNGGAGPYYGLFKFGEQDTPEGSCSWEDGDLVGDLSAEFPHTCAWNLPDSFWSKMPDPGPGTSVEEEDRRMAAWDKELEEYYWSPRIMNGAIPICHIGCALRQWLVINGPQKGFVWEDDRADNSGIYPLRVESGKQVTFADWYMSWLTEKAMQIRPNQPVSAGRTWGQRFRDWFVLLLLICVTILGYSAYLFIRMVLGLPLPGDKWR